MIVILNDVAQTTIDLDLVRIIRRGCEHPEEEMVGEIKEIVGGLGAFSCGPRCCFVFQLYLSSNLILDISYDFGRRIDASLEEYYKDRKKHSDRYKYDFTLITNFLISKTK